MSAVEDGDFDAPAIRDTDNDPSQMAPCWKHPSAKGSWIFRRGDTYHLSRVYAKTVHPRGLINLLGIWWAPQDNNIWRMLESHDLRDSVYRFAARQFWQGKEGASLIAANAPLVDQIIDALSAFVGRGDKQPYDGIPLQDGKLDPLTNVVTPFELEDFANWTLPFSSSALTLGPPTRWLSFLQEGFSSADIDLLQEFFGYCLSGSTKYQKSLWIYGEPGCGKSIIFKVLIAIVGRERTAIRKSENFRSNFNGDLLGKRLVYFPDYRHEPKSAGAALSFLLTVVGDDPIQIERKYKEAVQEMLMAKVVWSSNDMPVFPDTAAASLRRFMVMHRKKPANFVEDPGLADTLLAEAPQILQWATVGAKRLALRGRFDSGMLDAKLIRFSARSMNATYAFLEDACILGKGVEGVKVDKQIVFEAWNLYANETGHHKRYNRETFASSLMQTASQLGTKIRGEGECFVNIDVKSKYKVRVV